MKTGTIILLGAGALGFYLFRKAKEVEPKYAEPTEGWTTLQIYWEPGYDLDWYGDGMTAREEALQMIGQPYNSLGIIDGVEHVEFDAVNDIHAEGVRGALLPHEAVGDVVLLGGFA